MSGSEPTIPLTMRRATLAALLLVLAQATSVAAQERPSPSLDVTAGRVGFADDGVVNEGAVIASVRWYLSPRVSIGPEGTWIFGKHHSHQVVTGNVVFDLRAPDAGGARRTTGFVVMGGGLFRTSESFNGRAFSSTEGAFTVGGGLRVPVGDRAAFAADLRLGWELHLRLAAGLAIRLGS